MNSKLKNLIKKADKVILESEILVYEADRFMKETYGELQADEAEDLMRNYERKMLQN